MAFLKRLWWLVVDKPKPLSAFLALVAYMFAMVAIEQTELWFWTALPLYWAWVSAVWWWQAKRAGALNADP
ncbi:hypothetical protein, partial [Phenylobacterium sp.]|uniref:hypothetical protein n=1 Tax=Phenylobacterium sp. TaxID=1871053 RepID=UPI0025E60663